MKRRRAVGSFPVTLTVSVIVITYERPDHLKECLACLDNQTVAADQIIVVDASVGNDTATVVAEWPDVEYVANPTGSLNMANSRNAGLRFANGDVVAFLDDDAFASASYVDALLRAYSDTSVGLACSRTLNGIPGEELVERGSVGRLLGDGSLTGNFTIDATENFDIDHGIGATMSFRRDTLAAMGGFREDYGGVSGVREDTDAFLRARALGFRAVFVGQAVARHAGAPQARGQRFDLRYHFWSNRNHALLLINNFGMRAPVFWRYVVFVIKSDIAAENSRWSRRMARGGAAFGGLLRGCILTILRQRGRPLPLSRSDPVGSDLRRRLSRLPSSE
jgi:GT2 family glycosyltransferase